MGLRGLDAVQGAVEGTTVGRAEPVHRGVVERLLVLLRVPDHLARLLASTPSMHLSWVGSVAAVLGLAALAADRAGRVNVFLVLAPLLPLAGVAAAYGPAADPAHDISQAAPVSSFRLMLIRSTAVLVTSSVLSLAASAFLPLEGWRIAAWILPSLAVTVAGLLLSTITDPVRAASIVAFGWVAATLTLTRLDHDVANLFGGPAQAGFSAFVFVGATGLVKRRDRFETEQRAIKREIVTAADAERRRLERNLHDGAQQQLIGISINVRLAKTILLRGDQQGAVAMLEQLETDVADAVASLRELARGMYPPVLAEHGLVTALEAQVARNGLPVVLDSHNIQRYTAEVEATVYFCCLEALQNVAKYARAQKVTVRLSDSAGELTFAVRDDGVGFDPQRTPRGAGLRNLEERLAAFGGNLTIRSRPGGGTTISGTLPRAV